jgi:outer membrane protein
MKKHVLVTTLACALMGGALAAHADTTDSWVVKVGAHTADPKSNNGTLAGGTLSADVGSDTKPTITAEYLFTPNWGVEVLASLPFEHEIRLNGVKAGSAKHLPPTVSAQYHFNAGGSVSPFVGVGLNYTLFFSEHTTGPLAGTKLSLGSSIGPAVHGGIDFNINERWLLTVDARWMNLDSDVKVNGAKVGTVHIDPVVYGIAVGYRF